MIPLVVRGGALGDFVLTLPVIAHLARKGPVHVACPARYAVLLPEGAVRVDDAWIWAGRTPPHRYPIAYAFSPTAADCLLASGIPEVRAVAPRPPAGVHATVHYAAVVEEEIDLRPRIAVAPTVAGRPVVIAPGSGGADKRWPILRWLEVARALGTEPVWVAGPVEEGEDGWPAGTVRPDLPGLIGLAAAAGVWVGPDSGPSHVAAAVGTPVVAVFGPTDPAVWGPVGATIVPWDTAPARVAAIAREVRRGP